MITKTLGSLLEQKMKEKFMSFRALAKVLGMQSCGTVYQWTKGRQFPTKENLQGLANFLEITEKEVTDIIAKESGYLPRKSPSNNRTSIHGNNSDDFYLEASDLDRVKPMVTAYGKPMPISLFRQIVESQRLAQK